MYNNTLKAIAKRVDNGEKKFTIGEYTYFADYDRKTVIHYFNHCDLGPQITYFSELPLKGKAEEATE